MADYQNMSQNFEPDHMALLENSGVSSHIKPDMADDNSDNNSVKSSVDGSTKSAESFETSLPSTAAKTELLGKSKCGIIIVVENTDSCNNLSVSSDHNYSKFSSSVILDRGKLLASYEQGRLKLLDASRSGSLESLESIMSNKSETTKLTKGETSCWQRNKLCVLRTAALLAACGCFTVIGALMVFNEYANALKEKFHLSQIQVEATISMLCFAANLGYPAGLMGEKLGPKKTLCVAMFLVVGNYLLLWSTQFSMDFYIRNSWLFYIYYFLLGLGSCFGFIPIIPIMINNFSPKQYGCVTGFLFSFFFVGPAIYAAIYGALFITGHVYDEAKQDLNGYFLFCAVSSFILYLLAIIFVRPVPQDAPTKELQKSQLVSSFSINSFSLQNIPIDTPDLTGCALFRVAKFQLLLWPTVFMNSVQQTFVNNMSAYLKSYHQQTYITLVAILAPVIGTVANIVIGLLSDYTAPKVPRIVYQILFNGLQAVLLALCLFYIENIVLFIFTTVVTVTAFSGMITITPTMLTEISGAAYYGRNIGGLYIGQGMGILLLQTILGLFYDANANSDGTCYGLHCFRWSFVIALILTIISVTLECINLYLTGFKFAAWRKRNDYASKK